MSRPQSGHPYIKETVLQFVMRTRETNQRKCCLMIKYL